MNERVCDWYVSVFYMCKSVSVGKSVVCADLC